MALVRIYDLLKRKQDDSECELTWISTSRLPFFTHGNPSDNVVVEVDPVPKYDETAPITLKNTLTGQIKASDSSTHGTDPTAKILIQLSDVS